MGSPRTPETGMAGKPCGPLYLAPTVISNSVKTGRYPNESAHRASILSRSERLERKDEETATVETGLFMGFSLVSLGRKTLTGVVVTVTAEIAAPMTGIPTDNVEREQKSEKREQEEVEQKPSRPPHLLPSVLPRSDHHIKKTDRSRKGSAGRKYEHDQKSLQHNTPAATAVVAGIPKS